MRLRRLKRDFKRVARELSRRTSIKLLAFAIAMLQLSICSVELPAFFSSPNNGDFQRELLFNWLENRLIDLWHVVRGPIEPPSDIFIVAADEISARKLSVPTTEEWPRELHARLIRTLARAGVKSVFFDIVLVDEKRPEDDLALAAAIEEVPTFIARFERQDVLRRVSGLENRTLVLEPLPLFAKHAKRVLHIGLRVDGDHVVRHFNTSGAKVTGLVPIAAAINNNPRPHTELPTPRDFIKYYGPPGSLPVEPYYKILESSDKELENLRGKHAFVGLMLLLPSIAVTANSNELRTFKDSFRIPGWSGSMFGVEIHATTANNLLEQSWIRRFSHAQETVVLSTAAGLLSLAFLSLTPTLSVLALILSFAAWGFASYRAFVLGYFLPGLSLFVITGPTALFLSLLRRYLLTRRSYKQFQHELGIDTCNPPDV